jgi:hypothetical protein
MNPPPPEYPVYDTVVAETIGYPMNPPHTEYPVYDTEPVEYPLPVPEETGVPEGLMFPTEEPVVLEEPVLEEPVLEEPVLEEPMAVPEDPQR